MNLQYLWPYEKLGLCLAFLVGSVEGKSQKRLKQPRALKVIGFLVSSLRKVTCVVYCFSFFQSFFLGEPSHYVLCFALFT